jgi:hypothetical protein
VNSLNLAPTHTALLRGPEPRLLTTICWPQVEPDGFEPAAFSPAWNCELLSNPYRVAAANRLAGIGRIGLQKNKSAKAACDVNEIAGSPAGVAHAGREKTRSAPTSQADNYLTRE